MHTHVLICLFACCAIASAQSTNVPGFVPYEKFSPGEKMWADLMMKAARSDFAAACINLARDVQDKRLTVYSVVSTTKTSITNEAGFKIHVIYNSELAEHYGADLGSYQRHYNGCLLVFALAQYSEGKKALGLRLVRLLAEAEPELSWSSSQIQPLSIKNILARLESNDGSLAGVLEQCARDWRWREKDFKL